MKAKLSNKPGEIVLEIGERDETILATAGAASKPRRPLFSISRILVPIDFSDCARKALRYAIPLAKEHAAALTLLYVVPKQYSTYDYGSPNMPSLEAEMFVDGERKLKALLEEEVCGEVPAETLVRNGSAADDIVEAARTLPADLIVISTHGRTGLMHVLLGSVAEHVVRKAPCPVLVVRENENEFVLN